MIAQFLLSGLLGGLLVYAIKASRRTPIVSWLSAIVAIGGLYVVWMPSHASAVAEWVGIGRGADLVLYIWAAMSIIIVLNLHLKLRGQLELITVLARHLALLQANDLPAARRHPPGRLQSEGGGRAAAPARSAR
jgi:hypothetical protein